MPYAPSRPCIPGCPSLVRPGQPCPRHGSGTSNERRGGSGWQWQRTRERILRRDGHRCTLCGTPAGAMRIDHITPLAMGGSNEDANLRVLCLRCHQRVSRGGGG